ncbi:hypothetical protein [Flavobacterium lindanitolerans]|uniref:hypothetical protein n=1 Tax=Flavobacterium lindanitolerans TaxID=428988 RepID=UPI0031A9D950
MKKSLLLAAMSIVLLSCGNSTSGIEKEIQAYIEKTETDLAGYEPIETTLIDTIYTDDLSKMKIKNYTYAVSDAKNTIATREEINRKAIRPENDQYLQSEKKRLTYEERNLEIVKGLKNASEFYLYQHKCRLKNHFGALEVTDRYAITDMDRKILAIAKSEKAARANIESLFNEKYGIKEYNPFKQ